MRSLGSGKGFRGVVCGVRISSYVADVHATPPTTSLTGYELRCRPWKSPEALDRLVLIPQIDPVTGFVPAGVLLLS